MEIKRVDTKQLNDYVKSSYKPHFMQTGTWGEVNEARGNCIAHNLLIYDNDKIIGSALLIEKKLIAHSTFYCPRGFICNYDNKDDVKNVVDALKKYVNDNNGIYLKIDPDIIIRKLNSDTSVKEEYPDSLSLIDYLTSLGGKHRGFTTSFTESSCPRFTFRVNVSQDNLLDSFHQTTRNILRRNNPYGLKINVGTSKDIDKFYEPMKETFIRKHMFIEDKKFFETFYNILNKYKMSDLYVVSVNKKELINKYKLLINNDEKELEEIKDTNKKGKINDLNDQLNKYHKELKLVEAVNKEEIILSSMITVKFADIVWTIHGANSDSLPFLNANYELYYQIIKDAKDQGYTYVDFYGSEGKIDKKSEAYGIYQFKVRFSGDFDEFIGEFDFITKPHTYKAAMDLLKKRRRVKYKIQQIKNRRK